MKIFRKIGSILLIGLALAGSVALTACNDDKDEFSTNQYTGGVKLNVWGPCPVARGGELRFLGSGMDKITAITLPGSGKITDLKLINNEEVRITVPQDAEEGYLIVHTSEGDITAKTLLSFLEPISIQSISPMIVKPGSSITIKGEYLNNIHEIIFSEDKANADVTVSEDDFLTHTRNEISLTVPAEAKSGVIILSDADEDMPNWIISDEELTVVTPTVDEILSLESVNPGDEITISGKDLDLVVTIVMANEEEIDFTYTPAEGEAKETITFTIPENACDGPICMITASGKEIVAINIGKCQPEDLVATPEKGLRGNDEVVLTGKNLQMISSISLQTSGDRVYADFNLESNEKIVFKFPAEAQSADVELALKGGGNVYIYLETAKPEVLTNDHIPAGTQAALSGKNLDLLVSITFAGNVTAKVENSSADSAIVTIPVTAQKGAATLNMANGETSSWEANISEPTGAYIIEGPSAEDEIKAGQVAMFTIGNPGSLSEVLVNGEKVQYIVNGSILYVNLPESCGNGTIITLVSNDDSQLEYTYDFIPATKVGLTIWSGMFECSGWNGNQDLAYGGFDWSTIPAGALMTIYLTSTKAEGEWWCIALRNGNWANLPGDAGAQFDSPNEGFVTMVLTKEILDDLVATNGLIIFGDGYIMTRIDVEWENSLETVVPFEWSDVDMGNYSINLEGRPGSAFIDAGVKLGGTMKIYCTPTADYDYDNPAVHIQIFDGHWGAMTFDEINGGGQFNESTWGDMSLIEIKITPEIYEKFTTLTDWGYCIIFQGNNIIINKVTVQ